MINVCRNTEENLRGMLGILQEGDDPDLEIAHGPMKKAMLWLKQNNELYKQFYGNLETMHGYMKTDSAGGLFTGMPSRTNDLSIMDDGAIPASQLNLQGGLVFPAEISATKPYDVNDIEIGKQVARSDTSTISSKTEQLPSQPSVPNGGTYESLTYGDASLEAKVFPHLFPYGQGSWHRKKNSLTIGAYHKLKLLHVDRRWANDR